MHITCHCFETLIQNGHDFFVKMLACIFELLYAEVRINLKIQRLQIDDSDRLIERTRRRSEHSVHNMALGPGIDKQKKSHYNKIIIIKW